MKKEKFINEETSPIEENESIGNLAGSPDASIMSFGGAIEYLKMGRAVARSGWNGKKMSLTLNKGSIPNDGGIAPRLIDGVRHNLFSMGGAGTVVRLPNIDMKTASGSIVRGWLASQTDILAEDWYVLD
jgi:hypothetical protein